MNAFGAAVVNSDDAQMTALLGAKMRRLIPPVGADIRYQFLTEWAEAHAIRPDGDARALVEVGRNGWTLPIPLVKAASGWQFDTRAGVEEMRLRRIGRNELAVIQTMLAIYDAQHEYVQADHDGDGMHVYAGKLASSPGKRDGLYWQSQPGEPESPLGPAFLAASSARTAQDGYHGYRFKLLTSQGPAAPGGKYGYVVNGKLFGGFAVLAWPLRYGDTGLKSFMVSHDGQVYERDMGPETATKAAEITTFDPGTGWSKVQQ